MRRLFPLLGLLALLVAVASRLGPYGTADAAGFRPDRPALLDCTGKDGVSARHMRQAQEAWALHLGCKVEETVEIREGVKMTFVLVPPGKFLMGSPTEEHDYVTRTFCGGRRPDWFDEETLHEVTLTEPYFLGKYEVTQDQYEALIGANPSKLKEANRPVEMVNWEEANEFASKLTRKLSDKHLYRLPTEAEWEYACRGGHPSSHPFGIGDGISLSSSQANFNGNHPYGEAAKGPYLQKTCSVGTYKPNPLGLYDMHGNVAEWCSDWFDFYAPRKATNPTGPSEGTKRVYRGGEWGRFNYNGYGCRAAFRIYSVPSSRFESVGFRLARSIPAARK